MHSRIAHERSPRVVQKPALLGCCPQAQHPHGATAARGAAATSDPVPTAGLRRQGGTASRGRPSGTELHRSASTRPAPCASRSRGTGACRHWDGVAATEKSLSTEDREQSLHGRRCRRPELLDRRCRGQGRRREVAAHRELRQGGAAPVGVRPVRFVDVHGRPALGTPHVDGPRNGPALLIREDETARRSSRLRAEDWRPPSCLVQRG